MNNQLHLCTQGSALNVRHFRRNDKCDRMEELPPIDKNLEYDFDFQVSYISFTYNHLAIANFCSNYQTYQDLYKF